MGGPLAAQTPLLVPVHRVTDSRTRVTQEQFRRFWFRIWPEAVRDFGRCGIELQCSDGKGEIKLSPAGRPIFVGLQPRVLNLVLTDSIPMEWDQGRGLAGVTTRYEGYHLCVIALHHAHGHRIPFVAVNTCVHEILHALLGDIFVSRPTALQVGRREFRIDWQATRLWLLRDAGDIRRSAAAYLKRMR